MELWSATISFWSLSPQMQEANKIHDHFIIIFRTTCYNVGLLDIMFILLDYAPRLGLLLLTLLLRI